MTEYGQAQHLGEGVMAIIWIGLIGVIGILMVILLFHVWRRAHARERHIEADRHGNCDLKPDVWESSADRIDTGVIDGDNDYDEDNNAESDNWFPDR